MKTTGRIALLSSLLFAGLALPAGAADRIRAGEWQTTATINGQTSTSSVCISQSDADLMNGDVKSVRSIVEKTQEPSPCRVRDVTVNGSQVKVTSFCFGQDVVTTTTYRGDSYEALISNGSKLESKRVGACK